MQTFIGIGDIHGHAAVATRIPGIAQAAGILVSGDMTNLGGVEEVSQVLTELLLLNPRVLAQIGNMDQPPADRWLTMTGQNLHRQIHRLAPGLYAMGLGYSTTTPFGTPAEVSEETMAGWLAEVEERWRMAEAVAEGPEAGLKTLVFVCHTPPYGTACDRLGSGVHVGSRAVRDFLLRVRPACCLTGHIHESRGLEALGATVVVNPGDLAGGGYARLAWDGQKLEVTLEEVAA